ncbi:unnamed protein product [Dovyalis caffra]|uniref:Uncharacterized protein n=1 Tax=Dovyalis caffra TaxID=77055 RepID=A0AAV1R1H5_9ROSI|nr:unnamed protein product [Dovyalis caffra]
MGVLRGRELARRFFSRKPLSMGVRLFGEGRSRRTRDGPMLACAGKVVEAVLHSRLLGWSAASYHAYRYAWPTTARVAGDKVCKTSS